MLTTTTQTSGRDVEIHPSAKLKTAPSSKITSPRGGNTGLKKKLTNNKTSRAQLHIWVARPSPKTS